MPKRTDIKKVMVIGSGPIVIGQAAEFDYAGTQACLALKEEGYEVVLVNSNPATIQTDRADSPIKVYTGAADASSDVAKIVRYERPDAIVPGLGGQTDLNLAVQLAKKRRASGVSGGDSGYFVPEHRAGRGPRTLQGALSVAGRAGAAVADC